MAPLPTFQLPLISGGPPDGFGWEQREFSDLSRATAFIAGINERDKFLGRNRCVICGIRTSLELCYIIPKSEPETWVGLKRRDWLPEETKERTEHEPRDGLLMCRNHNCSFDEHHFFIRFLPDVRKFVSSTIPVMKTFRNSTVKPLRLTTEIAMRRSLLYSSSMRCAFADDILSSLQTLTFPMTSLGNSGFLLAGHTTMCQILSTVVLLREAGAVMFLRDHCLRFGERQWEQATLCLGDAG